MKKRIVPLLIAFILLLTACQSKTDYLSGELTGDPALDENVAALLTELCETGGDPLKSVYDWLCAELKYRARPGESVAEFTDETIISLASEALDKRRCDCDGEAALTAVLLRRLGYDAEIVQGQFLRGEGGEWVDHAWVRAVVDGADCYFDPLYDAHFTDGDTVSCFKASAAEMEATHRWN
ncbi:MAG: transglutaminase domain-containing protein [Oscillospiraceae bacterium]|nr:transglutaminase domain-containing protein [Oscillospiraceae bacterium]